MIFIRRINGHLFYPRLKSTNLKNTIKDKLDHNRLERAYHYEVYYTTAGSTIEQKSIFSDETIGAVQPTTKGRL